MLCTKCLGTFFPSIIDFKHLVHQLPFSENEKLVWFPGSKIIFLWRKNHLQRLIFNEISMRVKHWQADTSKVIVARFTPFDLESMALRLNNHKNQLKTYKQMRPLQTRFSIGRGVDPPHKSATNPFHHKGTKVLFSRLSVTLCLRGSSKNANRWQICKNALDNVSSKTRVDTICQVGVEPATLLDSMFEAASNQGFCYATVSSPLTK